MGVVIVGIIDPQAWGGRIWIPPPPGSRILGMENKFPPQGVRIWGGRFLADPQNRSSPPKMGVFPPPKMGVENAFPPKMGVKIPKIFACGAIFLPPPQPLGWHVLNFLGGKPFPPQDSPPPGPQTLGVKFPPPGVQNLGRENAFPPPKMGV